MNTGTGPYVFFALLPFIIYIFLIGLGVYFVFKAIKFMNEKIMLDRERNDKLTELIQSINQRKE